MGKIDCSVEKILKLYLKLDEHKKQEFFAYLEKICEEIKTSQCTKSVR